MVAAITDIIMLSETSIRTTPLLPLVGLRGCGCLALIIHTNCAIAQGNLNLLADVSAEAIYQSVKSDTQGLLSYNSYTLTPNVSTSFDSKTFNGIWSAGVTYIDRENDVSNDDTTFPKYSYSANWQAIENYLTVAATGTLSYQNTAAGNYLLTDFINNPQELAKTRSNRFSSNLQLENNDWVRAEGTATYSDVASEESTNTQIALNNDSYSLQGRLSSGDRARFAIWALSGSFQTTQQEDRGEDFITRNAQFVSDIALFDSFSFRLNATHEGNQISSLNDTTSFTRSYNTLGVGLTYRTALNRYVSITANESDSSEESNDNESFIGIDLEWALSNRTSLSASFGKRFYGDAADVQFTYNTKNIRTVFSYSESVTNTSRLLANPENLGVFVCPVNSTALSDCFQPNSLTYTPTAEEQIVQLTTQNIEFDDNVILRKSGNFQFGYSFSKISTGFSWRYAEDEYLDLNRLRRSYSGTLNLVYQLGSYTDLQINASYANVTERGDVATGAGDSENYNANTSINRTFGRNLTASLKFTYLDKSGNLTNDNLFGADYIDRRLSVVVAYKYE